MEHGRRCCWCWGFVAFTAASASRPRVAVAQTQQYIKTVPARGIKKWNGGGCGWIRRVSSPSCPFTDRLFTIYRSCGATAALARQQLSRGALHSHDPIPSRARRSRLLRLVCSGLPPVFYYLTFLLFTALPHACAHHLCSSFLNAGERGHSRTGQGRTWHPAAEADAGRRGWWPWPGMGTPFAASDESSRSARIAACLPDGFARGGTARYGPRVSHRVTRHRAVLLAQGPRAGRVRAPGGGAQSANPARGRGIRLAGSRSKSAWLPSLSPVADAPQGWCGGVDMSWSRLTTLHVR
jgi:hypothetical protein